MMAHACLLKETCLTLIGTETLEQNPTLRAARHARQLQDIHHAMNLYLQVEMLTVLNYTYLVEL